MDPYFIIPDRCDCVDFQTQRLQEAPDAVPHGEMPRHMQLYCDRYIPHVLRLVITRCFHISLTLTFVVSRYLCDRVVPGNRVTVMGIYSIKKVAQAKNKGRDKGAGVGIRSAYLRVVGIEVDTEGAGE